MRKILVLRGGALGDFIVTLPALALLRQRWPASRLELAGNATAAELGKREGLLDAVYSQHEARWGALYGEEPLPPAFSEWLAEFDLVVNFWPDPGGELRAKFPVRPDQVFLSGDAMPARAPAAAHYCEALGALGLTTTNYFHPLDVGRGLLTPPAYVDEGDRRGRETPPYRIAVHPGSGSPRKNWPLARWVELCAWLSRERGADLLIVTGEADEAAAEALAPFGESARNLPLPALAARLADCALFLGHDSGVSHLASACGVPSVLLFGPTDRAMWAPPAPHVTVLSRGPELNSISVGDVQAAVMASIAGQK